MPSCYDIVWAVPVVGGGVAAFGNPSGGEPVDIAFECGVVVVNELIDNLPMALTQRIDGEWRERWMRVLDKDDEGDGRVPSDRS